jgi:putative ABC transport system permease protein
MKWLDAARARLRLLFQGNAAEERMREEFGFHIEMEAERLMHEEGLDAASARRRALVAFGSAERYGEELRDGRGAAWLSGLSLDIRLGMRMLVKYPGLAIVGGLGIAVAITIAGVSFGVIYAMMDPALPFDGGDRVVMVQNLNTQHGNPDRGTHLHDLSTWREQLRSVTELGAFRTVRRNIADGEGGVELVSVAQMSATGFTITRVAPLIGRPLQESDERADAAAAVVIGEDVWRNRFAGDANIIGRTIRLGTVEHEVVGVMPARMRFPVNHEYWTPLRLNDADYERGAGPSLDVFGRLVEGTTLERARIEVATVRDRLAATYPDVYEHVTSSVMPYTFPFFDIDSPSVAWAFHLIQVLITLLLVIVGVNVAVLMYARTASRLGEITVRTALGASRRRVVLQLLAEALVLSAIAAGVGLVVSSFVLQRVGELLRSAMHGELPFWLDPQLSPGLTVYAVVLAVLAAVIVGAVPALKATGTQIQSGLRSLGAGGSGLQLGRTWTFLIIAQVAVAVAVLPGAVHNAQVSMRHGMARPPYPAHEYLQAWVGMEKQPVPTAQAKAYEEEHTQRLHDATVALMDRLDADPVITHVTVARDLPTTEQWIRVVVGDDTAAAPVHVAHNRVAPDYFDAFDMRIVLGRGLNAGDATDASTAVVVDRTFVERTLDGGNVLGRVLRYTAPDYEMQPDLAQDRQFEIVGVVESFPRRERPDEHVGTMYRAFAPGQMNPAALIARARGGDASPFVPRLPAIALETNNALEVDDLITMDAEGREWQSMMRMVAIGVVIATASVVLLSAAGIYAMMSFTITRRRREIGIRAALGAPPRQLLGAVFARAASQLGAGVVVGLVLAAVLDLGLEGGYARLLPVVAVLMLAVGALSALGPAMRGLRIQPTEALRED